MDFLILKIFTILPVFVRVFLFLRFTPIFLNIKIGYLNVLFSFMLSLVMLNNIKVNYQFDSLFNFIFILSGEAFFGILQAFFINIIFNSFHLLGYLFSNQMGLSYANIFDIFTEEDSPLISQFFICLFLLIFLLDDVLFRFFLIGIRDSIVKVRVENLLNIQSQNFLNLIFSSFFNLFEKSLIISFPILAVFFLLYLILGILSKTSPQINLLMISFSISLLLGLLILYIGFPSLVISIKKLIELLLDSLKDLVNLFSRKI